MSVDIEHFQITSSTVPDSFEWEYLLESLGGVDPLDLSGIEFAFEFAKRLHRNHPPRETGGPFIQHPMMVMRYLSEAGCTDPNTLISALLHDVAEDHMEELVDLGKSTRSRGEVGPYTLLEIHFGREVSQIVRFLSKPDTEGLSPGEKKQIEAAHVRELLKDDYDNVPRSKARLVKTADRDHNLRTMPWRTEDPLLLATDRRRIIAKCAETDGLYGPVIRLAERDFPAEGRVLARHLRQDLAFQEARAAGI